MRSQVFTAIFVVFLGCGFNALFIEAIIKIDPKSGTFVTFFQFLLVALIEAFLSQFDFKTFSLRPRKLPIKYHFLLTSIFCLATIVNNLAYYYNISQPFHITFRSSTLALSLLVGAFFFGKKYTLHQWVGVFCITVGVIFVTLVNSDYIHIFSSSCCDLKGPSPLLDLSTNVRSQATGLGLLTVALVAIAVIGHLQDMFKKIYGSDWRENMFYNHLLSILSIVLFYNDVRETFNLWSDNWIVYTFFSMSVPVLWLYTVMNGLTQYVCMSGVQMLAQYSDPLTLNIILTLRKFVSLIISLLIFKSDFGLDHMLGTVLVFGGTLVYYYPQTEQKVNTDSAEKVKKL